MQDVRTAQPSSRGRASAADPVILPGIDAILPESSTPPAPRAGSAAPPSKRDRTLELLRQAADAGVSKHELHEAGIPCPMVHVESLRFEDGIAIETRTLRTARGGYEDRYFLTRDERR